MNVKMNMHLLSFGEELSNAFIIQVPQMLTCLSMLVISLDSQSVLSFFFFPEMVQELNTSESQVPCDSWSPDVP